MVSPRSTTVVVADDHAPTRELVADALTAAGFDVRATVRDASAAVDAVREHAADLVILDVRMPGSGISAAREIAQHQPETVIVMFTVSSDDDDLFAAIAAGALGYIVKGVPGSEIVETVERVLAGEAALPPNMVRRLLDEFSRRERTTRLLARRPRVSTLSDREREVLDLLSKGLGTAAIASSLFVSQATVRTHVAAILRKLEVPDRKSAVRMVRDT